MLEGASKRRQYVSLHDFIAFNLELMITVI